MFVNYNIDMYALQLTNFQSISLGTNPFQNPINVDLFIRFDALNADGGIYVSNTLNQLANVNFNFSTVIDGGGRYEGTFTSISPNFPSAIITDASFFNQTNSIAGVGYVVSNANSLIAFEGDRNN